MSYRAISIGARSSTLLTAHCSGLSRTPYFTVRYEYPFRRPSIHQVKRSDMTCILTPSKYDVVTSLKERRSDNPSVLPAPMRFRGSPFGKSQRQCYRPRSEGTEQAVIHLHLSVILSYPGAPLLGRCLCPTDAALEYATCGLLPRVPCLR